MNKKALQIIFSPLKLLDRASALYNGYISLVLLKSVSLTNCYNKRVIFYLYQDNLKMFTFSLACIAVNRVKITGKGIIN